MSRLTDVLTPNIERTIRNNPRLSREASCTRHVIQLLKHKYGLSHADAQTVTIDLDLGAEVMKELNK